MINLQLAIHEGDVVQMEFNSTNSLLEYLEELRMFDCVWLVTQEGPFSEILITDNLTKVLLAIAHDMFSINEAKNSVLFFQEYQTFEDAYAVALDMREGHPKCYN